jgi:hypothetical protein
MKEIALKLGLAIGMQIINAGTIYGAVIHMRLAQIGGANPSDTLLMVAVLFIVAKLNFTLAKAIKQPLQNMKKVRTVNKKGIQTYSK